MQRPCFIDEDASFVMECPEEISQLYFPLASETGLKSCVSPDLGGDAKLCQETFLLEPVSVENLHNNRSTRNFWMVDSDGVAVSLTGASAMQQATRFTPNQDSSRLTAGLMWHTLERTVCSIGVHAKMTSFVPVQDNVEILSVTVKNYTEKTRRYVPYAAIPLYGRSADNLRDHRNVTSMLHRIHTTEHGVLVCPTMSFDERGHRPNHKVYYVLGYQENGQKPEAFYPTVEEFIGEGGTFTRPRAVCEAYLGVPAGTSRAGREAMGAFRFPAIELAPGESCRFVLLLGVEDSSADVDAIFTRYNSVAKIDQVLEQTKRYWKQRLMWPFLPIMLTETG